MNVLLIFLTSRKGEVGEIFQFIKKKTEKIQLFCWIHEQWMEWLWEVWPSDGGLEALGVVEGGGYIVG